MNKSNHDELISSVLDGELSDAQLDALLDRLKGQDGQQVMQTWTQYHELGDVLRSDDLAVALSPNFSAKMSALLDAEPVILAPQNTMKSNKRNAAKKSAYWAVTSVAATVILAFLMAPQIIPLLKSPSNMDGTIAKVESADPFSAPGVKLASNTGASASASSSGSAANHVNKEAEFAPKLENQVEMLRDPRLDSYLLAHQKVSPSLDNSARYVQRANVVSPTESNK
ncbi:sigma-E factor negative regulatory protein [Undibacterium flavidum]|uniref:Sigma-E factor negative regulatory protein n=1 Tax=Undibacterium flavidum TaxID=2762297 RepID=A0ABR6YCL5_9BURK|nr:sigma-E factor negative regulatory protein [Undibacterium flavidum]MBC3874291.1 sigma-E factor negative regulatory protein [Undibacterium flavidum]